MAADEDLVGVRLSNPPNQRQSPPFYGAAELPFSLAVLTYQISHHQTRDAPFSRSEHLDAHYSESFFETAREKADRGRSGITARALYFRPSQQPNFKFQPVLLR